MPAVCAPRSTNPPIKCLCMGPRDVTWRRARTSQVRGTRKGAHALVHPSSSSFTNSTLFPSAQLVYDSFSTLTSFALVPPLWLMACRSWRLTANALAHRAWLTREQSSIENDVGIQVTHLLVLCHLTGEKLNKTTVNSGNLLFWHRIWTISTWVFTRSKYKQILCK